FHGRIQRESARLAAEPPGGRLQGARQLRRDDVAVLGQSGGGFEHGPEAEAAIALEQPPPRLDRAWDRHGQRSSGGHHFVSAGADGFYARELARTAGPDESHGRGRAGRPHDRHQVAGNRRHVRVHHAQHRVGGDHRVDRVSAVPQDLSPNLRSEVMWGRYDPPRHRGVMNSIAPGWISKSAGRKPTSSPSRSMRTGSGDVTVIRLPYMSSIFGLLLYVSKASPLQTLYVSAPRRLLPRFTL